MTRLRARSSWSAASVGSAALASALCASVFIVGCQTSPDPATKSPAADASASASTVSSGSASSDGGAASAALAPAPATALGDGGARTNAAGIPEADYRAVVNPSNLPDYSGPTGTVEGTVWVDGDPPAARKEKVPAPGCPGSPAMYATTFREGPENDQKLHPLADSPVGVVDPSPPSTFYLPPRGAAETLKLTGCLPEKRTLAMTFGQSLDLLNKSGKLVAPQLQPSAASALMVATVNGDPVHLYPQRPGHYRLTDMLAKAALDLDVYVFLFSLHDVTTEQGRFRIEGVPVGKRRVFAHLPATDDEAFVDVDVTAGGTTTADITIHQKPKAAPTDAGPVQHPIVR